MDIVICHQGPFHCCVHLAVENCTRFPPREHESSHLEIFGFIAGVSHGVRFVELALKKKLDISTDVNAFKMIYLELHY